MRTIIAGSRDCSDMNALLTAIENCGWKITSVVSGACRGVDLMGEQWAEYYEKPIFRYPADWSKGPRAGPERNRLMARNADALIALWDGESKGTKNMIDEANARGLKVYVHFLDNKE